MAAKGVKDPGVINLPELKPVLGIITIEGSTPLICCNFPEKAKDEIEAKQTGRAANKKEARDPEDDFLEHRYLTVDGKDGFPSSGVKMSIVTAGGRFTELPMTQLRGLITIPGPAILPLKIDDEPVMRRDYVKPNFKTTTLAYRPEYFPWSLEVPVAYISSLITAEQVLNLFTLAGMMVGIGAWRPECDGNFGMFTVKGMK